MGTSQSRDYGVITNRYKLVHFYDAADYWELFDLQKDPEELQSVYDLPEYAEVRQQLTEEVKRQRVELKEPEVDDPRATGEKTWRARQANQKAKQPRE